MVMDVDGPYEPKLPVACQNCGSTDPSVMSKLIGRFWLIYCKTCSDRITPR